MPKPEVDDADVTRMIDFIFGRSFNDSLTAEARADAAYQVARGIALLQQRTVAYAEAFAERVRMKALWLKGPTGGVVEFPE
jgi:hypothetical protein